MSTLTKVFIVLQLVFAIALTVLAVITLGGIQKYKNEVIAEREGRLAAVAQVAKDKTSSAKIDADNRQLIKDMTNLQTRLNGEIENLKNTIQSMRLASDQTEARLTAEQSKTALNAQTIAALEKQLQNKDVELAAVRPQNNQLVTRNAEQERRINELSNEKDTNVKSIRTLQERIAELEGGLKKANDQLQKTGGAADKAAQRLAALNPGVPTAVQVNGKVQQVQNLNGRTFVTLSLGTRDGVVTGNRFTIYRGGNFIGDAVVQRATPDESVAVVTLSREPVQPTDLVISGGGL